MAKQNYKPHCFTTNAFECDGCHRLGIYRSKDCAYDRKNFNTDFVKGLLGKFREKIKI